MNVTNSILIHVDVNIDVDIDLEVDAVANLVIGVYFDSFNWQHLSPLCLWQCLLYLQCWGAWPIVILALQNDVDFYVYADIDVIIPIIAIQGGRRCYSNQCRSAWHTRLDDRIFLFFGDQCLAKIC